MIKSVIGKVLTDKQKYKIVSKKIDRMSNSDLDRVISKGSISLSVLLGMNNKRKKVKRYVHSKYAQGTIDDVFYLVTILRL